MGKYLKYLALAAILITFLGFFATKIWDIDFWWHIASGGYIVETFSLPDKDPFSVYTATGVQNDTVLKAQWLGEVILFLIFKTFGPDGIILFKAVVLTACLLIIYIRSVSLGSEPVYGMLVIFLSGMTALNFTGERPQLLSFLFASILFLLLENYKKTNRIFWVYCIPVIIVLWSNSHGAVVLGSVLLSLYAAGHILEMKLRHDDKKRINKPLLAVVVIAILITVITPSGIAKYLYVLQLQGSELQKRTSEYASPLILAGHSGSILIYYWIMLGIAIPALYQLVRDKEINKAVLVLVLALISLISFRYIPFFIFIASPYIASAISRLSNGLHLPQKTINSFIILASIFVLLTGVHSGRVFQKGVDRNRFPVDAVNFIKQNEIKGKMFNSMNWGGYTLWHLYPDIQIFIDGRAIIDINKVYEYTHILWATRNGLEFLASEQFDLVLIPYKNNFTGEVYNLNWYLLNHPQWQVLYRDNLGYLFRRRG